jgi:integrase
MPLTDTAIRNSKPTGRPYKVSDGGGLHLLINPNGSRLWRLKYRLSGREKLLSLGSYPAVSLKAARDSRDRAKELLAAGTDPASAKRVARQQAELASANTFQAIADEYVAKIRREGRADATLIKAEWLLGFANQGLGGRPVREITAAEVLEVLRRVEARGRHETARRLRAIISRVFRYAVATARADTDPTFALRGALTTPRVKSRAAITEPKAFGELLRAVDAFEGQPTTRAALQLMALLSPRPGELRLSRWEEFDLDRGVWTIPAERTKMRRPHRVPLPEQSAEILRTLYEITGEGELVFPSVRATRRPISENTLNAALRRLGYTSDQATAHGFRATFSTIANESGLWNPDAIERALAHVDGNSVRRAYARGEHWEERVRMAQWWADLLNDLREGRSNS